MKKTLLTLGFFALILSSCTLVETVYEDEKPISLSVYNEVSVRSVHGPIADGVYPENETFGVAAYYTPDGAGKAWTEKSNGHTSYFGFSKFKKGSGTYWTGSRYWPNNGSLYIAAYSPFVRLNSSTFNPSIAWDGSSAPAITFTSYTNPDYNQSSTPLKKEQDDLMYFIETTSKDSDYGIVFHHALSQVNFVVKAASEEYDEYIVLNKISVDGIANTATGVTGTDVKSIAWTGHTGANILIPFSNTKKGSESGCYKLTTPYESVVSGDAMLLIPDQKLGSITINYQISPDGGTTWIDQVEVYKPSSDLVFEEGKKYLFDVTISLTGIQLTPSSDSWTSENQTVTVPAA